MPDDDKLLLAGKEYHSRLLVGTGKYASAEQAAAAIAASGAEIVTVAIRRLSGGTGEAGLLDVISPDKYTILPNTAGCYDAKTAIRTCHLAREMLDGAGLVKLEVLGDEKSLLPDTVKTMDAAEELVREGFSVMAYTNDDPIAARQLADLGCVAVMPLAAPIGSGMGILNRHNIAAIVSQSSVPILVDAGVGTASDAAIAMELGCDGVLMNTAIAESGNPVLMAGAMRKAVQSGREAWLAGRIPARQVAAPSSPAVGTIHSA